VPEVQESLMTRYHAYAEYQESVYAWTGEADGYEDAAAQAAQANHVPGGWTVIRIESDPVGVTVRQRAVYEAERDRPA
jgi:hypothetical protein